MSSAVEQREGLTILPFAPGDLGLYAKSPDADGHVVPTTAAEALAATGALAVLDGPMFELCGAVSGATQVEQYRNATCAKLQALHIDPRRGLRTVGVPSTDGWGGVLSIESGHPVASLAMNRAQFLQTLDLDVAVQLRPTLVADGDALSQSTAGSNTTAEWRAACGILADSRLAFAIGVFSMQEFANRLARAGFGRAWYTDGGGSTRIELADGTHFGASENRRVASWLTVNRGSSLGSALLLGAGMLAAYWLWKRR